MPEHLIAPEFHSAWAIHGLDTEGREVNDKLIIYGRPHDWGHPRWSYHRFIFECRTLDQPFRHVCHCWTDLKRDVWSFARLFAYVIVLPPYPGRPVQLCGRDYLAEEDIWFPDWGLQPPIAPAHSIYDDLEGRDQ